MIFNKLVVLPSFTILYKFSTYLNKNLAKMFPLKNLTIGSTFNESSFKLDKNPKLE